MTRSRWFHVLLAVLCLARVWSWGLMRATPDAPAWLAGFHVLAFMGWFSATFDNNLPGRRLQVALSASLSLSTWLVQSLPIDHTTAVWPVVSQHLAQLTSLHGLRTQWQWSLLSQALGLPLVLISLLAHGMHQVTPRLIRRLAKASAALWVLVFFVSIGGWLREGIGAPSVVYLLGLLLLPWMLRGDNWPVAALLLSLCFCACLHMGLGWLWNIHELMSLLGAGLMASTALCWLSWFWLMNDIARYDLAHPSPPSDPPPSPPPPAAMPETFDLTAHLDSPSAQEGADKYTRE